MTFNHITLYVSDIERSTPFYCDGLGFKHVGDQIVGQEGGPTALFEGDYRVHSRRLVTEEGFFVILNQLHIPPPPLPAYRAQYGLTNLALNVSDLEQAIAKLSKLGGQPIENSRATFELDDHSAFAEVQVCLDPDGQPIELVAVAQKAQTHRIKDQACSAIASS